MKDSTIRSNGSWISSLGQQDAGVAVITPNGQTTNPSAGPYYVADFYSGEYLILKPNPNYVGPRSQGLDAIALREGVDSGQALGKVENGSWDGVINLYDPLLDPSASIAQEWGPGSRAAADGGQGYFAVPMPGVEALAFNSSRLPFSDPGVRLAAALALNRSALAGSTTVVNDIGAVTVPEVPSAQLLPPNQPGFHTGQDPYPLATPDLTRATALMRGRHPTARLAVASNCDTCRRWAEAVKTQLALIGIKIEMDAVSDPGAAVRKRGADLDLFEASAFQNFPDPAAFLTTLLGRVVPSSWLPPSIRPDLATLGSLRGEARIPAASEFGWILATRQVPATTFAYQVNAQLLSPRVGCRVFPPFGYGMDLAALCLSNA